MIKDMKFWVNGQEVPVPKELQGLMNMVFPPVIQPQVPVEKKPEKPTKILCRDNYLRKVVIDLNMRVLELEKTLALKKSKPKEVKKIQVNTPKKVINTKKNINPKQKKGSVDKKTSKTKKLRK